MLAITSTATWRRVSLFLTCKCSRASAGGIARLMLRFPDLQRHSPPPRDFHRPTRPWSQLVARTLPHFGQDYRQFDLLLVRIQLVSFLTSLQLSEVVLVDHRTDLRLFSVTSPALIRSSSLRPARRQIAHLLSLHSFLPFTWSVVGRALVRDLAVRRFWGDKEGEDSARQLAEDCLAFVENCNKSEVGITGESSHFRDFTSPTSLQARFGDVKTRGS